MVDRNGHANQSEFRGNSGNTVVSCYTLPLSRELAMELVEAASREQSEPCKLGAQLLQAAVREHAARQSSTLAARLGEAVSLSGLTVKTLAEQLDIDTSEFRGNSGNADIGMAVWLAAQLDAQQICMVAEMLGCSVVWLQTGNPSEAAVKAMRAVEAFRQAGRCPPPLAEQLIERLRMIA